MTNPYRKHLEAYFETINSLKHSTRRLTTVLLKDVKVYTADGAVIKIGTCLNISDWSGSNENEHIPAGALKLTMKEQYADEINMLLSREYGYVFAQYFEALERFMKQCIKEKAKTDSQLRAIMSKNTYSIGNKLRGGIPLLELVLKTSRASLKTYEKNIIKHEGFSLKTHFQTFAEVRHAIVHSQGIVRMNKLPKIKNYNLLFVKLFPLSKHQDGEIVLHFDYNSFNLVHKNIAEFGYQLYKLLSAEESLDWKISST